MKQLRELAIQLSGGRMFRAEGGQKAEVCLVYFGTTKEVCVAVNNSDSKYGVK